jgi:hypothetical protein
VVNGGLREKVKGGGTVSIAWAGTAVLFVPIVIMLFTVAPVIAQPVEVRVNAPEYVGEGDTFVVTIDITEVKDLNAAQFNLSFDPDVIEVSKVVGGEINGEEFHTFMHQPIAEDTQRVIMFMPVGKMHGSGYLAKIEFVAIGGMGDESALNISDVFFGHPIREGKGLSGKRLFTIDGKFRDELNNERISDKLKETFKDEGYPLDNPIVNAMTGQKNKWKLRDEKGCEKRIYVVNDENGLIVTDGGEMHVKWVDSEVTISIDEEDDEEEDSREVTPGTPDIIAWRPVETVVDDAAGRSRTFNISANQMVDISWRINDTEVQTNESTREAVYTNTSAVVGEWNVSAIATNTTTGLSDMHTWVWRVTLTATGTPTPTPTPEVTTTTEAETEETPVLTSTPAPGVTPTPTIPSQEPEVPGFEAILAIAVMSAVAYILLWRRR